MEKVAIAWYYTSAISNHAIKLGTTNILGGTCSIYEHRSGFKTLCRFCIGAILKLPFKLSLLGTQDLNLLLLPWLQV